MSWSLSLPVASLPYLAAFRGPFASDSPAEVALVSLPALCLRPWLTCIALLLLPVLCHHHFPCPVGTFVLVVLALLPSSPLRCRQHCKLASAQAQSSRNMHWHHCQYHALVVANVAPAPSPLLRRCLCPGRAGITALGTPTLPPASQTGICLVMMQLRPVVGEVLLLRSMLSPVALSLYPELAHSDFCLRRSGQGSNGILSSLSRCPCLYCTGVIASVTLFSMLALRRRCCRVSLQGTAGAAQAFASVALAPAYCYHRCQHRAFVHVTGIVSASLPCCGALFPLSHRHLCPHCLCLASSIVTLHLPRHDTVMTRTGIIASTAPLSLPAIVGIVALVPRAFFALVALVLPTLAYPCCACITNWPLPSHDTVATCTREASLLCSSLRSGCRGLEQPWFHGAQPCNLVIIQVILVNASSCLAEMAGWRHPRYLRVCPQPWVPCPTHRRMAALQNRPR